VETVEAVLCVAHTRPSSSLRYRRWVRRLELSQCAVVAERAMGAHSAADVEELSAGLRASLLVD